ncbi:Uncharacterised protein [Mycobacteroides abscessus subsp. abscessus]|nr:Uncharacterised protein [Mycobacteroides abscessus subsp. abscessus]
MAPMNRSGSKRSGRGKATGSSCIRLILTTTECPCGMRYGPMSTCGASTWRPAKSMTGRLRCTSRMVAWRYSLLSPCASSASRDSTSGCRVIRSNAHAKVVAVVSWPAASSVSSSSETSLRDIVVPSS